MAQVNSKSGNWSCTFRQTSATYTTDRYDTALDPAEEERRQGIALMADLTKFRIPAVLAAQNRQQRRELGQVGRPRDHS